MPKTLTFDGLQRAARRLGVEVATIEAVAQVEAAGDGFLPDGRPKILFERHVFSRRTNHRFDATEPELSSPVAGGYLGGASEYNRLYLAAQLDPDAAAESASWGTFQIMGLNWPSCGEKSLIGFLLAMHHDVDAHLALFCEFIKSKGLVDHLRRRDWAAFARSYNGAAYAKNQYDTKLAAAYAVATQQAPAGDGPSGGP